MEEESAWAVGHALARRWVTGLVPRWARARAFGSARVSGAAWALAKGKAWGPQRASLWGSRWVGHAMARELARALGALWAQLWESLSWAQASKGKARVHLWVPVTGKEWGPWKEQARAQRRA